MSRAQSRAVRLEKLERRLYTTPKPLTVKELAEYLKVTPRTVYRDLQALEELHIPVFEENGRYQIDRELYTPVFKLIIDRNEAMALFIATRLLSHYSDEENPHIVSALDRLAAAVTDPTISAHIQRAADVIRKRRPIPRFVQVLENLTRAWAEQRKVRISYRSFNGEETERVIYPYFLEPSGIGNALYVMAFDELRGQMRTFKVERIQKAEILAETYQIPPQYDPYRQLENSWGIMWGEEEVEIRLRFTPRVARRVKESVWHHSQCIEDLSDGGCLFTVRIGNPTEMKPWIRSWGPDVEVLAPPALRQEIADEACKTAELYR